MQFLPGGGSGLPPVGLGGMPGRNGNPGRFPLRFLPGGGSGMPPIGHPPVGGDGGTLIPVRPPGGFPVGLPPQDLPHSMQAFKALGAGLRPGQIQRLLAGHTPGEEQGAFSGMNLSPQQLHLIGLMAQNGRFGAGGAPNFNFQQFMGALNHAHPGGGSVGGHIPVDQPIHPLPGGGSGLPPVLHHQEQSAGHLPPPQALHQFAANHPWFQRMIQHFGLQGVAH